MFRHTDYATIRQSGRISKCTNCQMLFNLVSKNEVQHREAWFRSTEYSRSNLTHTLFADNHVGPVPRTILQAELLRELITGSSPSILDIGCFDGELLIELNRQLSAAELHGFDVNEHLAAGFPSASNFHFWAPDLNKVEGRFDLICISGSMVYIADLNELMLQIRRLLKPDGLVFVQVVDIAKSPYAVLLGDQRSHYSPQILGNLFGYFGFELSLLESSWAPREIVGVARLGTRRATQNFEEDTNIHLCLSRLDHVAEKLGGMALPDFSQVGVLGTTAAAAFTDSVLESRFGFYVDENPKRLNEQFRNKQVIHPQSLDDSHSVIIPYGALNQEIKLRFDTQYKGQFICL